MFAAIALAAAAAAPPPVGCDSPESHQFDFWVGRWEVFDAKSGQRAGASLIEKLYGGCVLRENWSEPGFSGGSLNIYVKRDARWRQTWADQAGALREFVGGIEDGRMVLVAPTHAADGRPVKVRMIFTPNPDGTVRQFSDYSADGGASWTFRYDYLYRPIR